MVRGKLCVIASAYRSCQTYVCMIWMYVDMADAHPEQHLCVSVIERKWLVIGRTTQAQAVGGGW